MNSLRALSSPLETMLTTGEMAWNIAPRKVGGAVVRHLKHFGLQIKVPCIVLAGEKAAGFIIQVTREEITESAVDQSENDGLAIDGVRCRKAFEVLFV